jgi:hypothetical protein
MPQNNIAKACRQNASSPGASVSSEDTANARAVMQTQLMGVFGAMPVLLPHASLSGRVVYGAPHSMALEMSKRTLAEYLGRIGSLPPEIQVEMMQKLVEERKQASLKVRLVFISLMPIDHDFGFQARNEAKDSPTGLITRNQGKTKMVV